MSETTGRAGFHVEHTKNVGERGAILHEAMRELDPDAIDYWAKRNPSIVVADEVLNEAMVNNGVGGFKRCTDKQQVIDYGAARVARVGHKLKTDQPDPKTGKMRGGTITTSLIVSHLPKSLCVEVPDFYPRFKKNGAPLLDPKTGEQMRRSRWVARDRDEARRYFEAVLAYVAKTSIPGGIDGVLGYDIQHSETTPHIQIVADAFGEHPEKPGVLRADASRAWFAHRDVRGEDGKIVSGRDKLRGYHSGLKAHLIEVGYEVSADFDEERHTYGGSKGEYEVLRDQEAEIQAELDVRETQLDELAEELDAEAAELRQQRHAAAQQGYADGKAQGVALVEKERQAAAEDRRAADVARRAAEAALKRLDDRESEYDDALVRLTCEYDRLLDRPAVFDAYLDQPMKDNKTLRPSFERFASKFAQRHPRTIQRPRPKPVAAEDTRDHDRGLG